MRSLQNFLTSQTEEIARNTTGRRVLKRNPATSSMAAFLALLLLAAPAAAKSLKPVADEPAPPKAVPVQSVDAAPLLPVGATITEGTPVAITGDTLQIGDKTLRLYGIAAPDIRANHGADARATLDQLIAQRRVQCTEFDRTKDGLVIAACKADDADLAEQMLLTGYAAVYRSQINPTQQELDLARRYDAAEAKARDQHLGLWTLPQKPAAADVPKPAPEPWITRAMLQNWIVAAPILLIALIALTLYGRARGREWREDRRQLRLSSTSLLAQILAEVLAIREAAAEQIGHLANLPPENPIPPAELALMGLPPALIYAANAGQLYRLPRDTGVDLVQFYAAHAGTGMMLRQPAHLRAAGLRQAYVKIVEAADLVLERGQKQLG